MYGGYGRWQWYSTNHDGSYGQLARSGWFHDGVGDYTDPSGTHNAGAGWYLAGDDGFILSGWQQVNGSWYYLNPEHDSTFGMMLTGWQQVGGSWYYLDPATGAMQTGWLRLPDGWYYLDPTTGALWQDATTPDGWRVDASGRWAA